MSTGRIRQVEDRVEDLDAQIRSLLQREATHGHGRQVRIAKTVAMWSSSSNSAASRILEIVALDCSAPAFSSSSSSAAAVANCFPIVFCDVDAPATPGNAALTVLPRQPEDNALFVAHSLDDSAAIPHGKLIEVFRHNKKDRWWTAPPVGGSVGIMLAQAHPGKGNRFSVWVGTWDPVSTGWMYDTTGATATAIDWRHGVPYPGMYSTGLAEWRPWVQ
jgi:hypothetical protein